MSKIEKAILTLNAAGRSSDQQLLRIDPRARLIVTVAYLTFVLIIPLDRLSLLIWFAVYPIVAAPIAGISYGRVLFKSLWILPVAALFGIFNPYFDRQPAMRIGLVMVSHGWLTFFSLTVRGLLSFQALIILIAADGFTGLCKGMNKLGIPGFLTSQILFVYRYLSVLLQEALTMKRAREARGYGRKSMPLNMWGEFIGQLFLRTVARSERIHLAMLSRGFTGTLPDYEAHPHRWSITDSLFLICWLLIFVALCFLPVTTLFSRMITH